MKKIISLLLCGMILLVSCASSKLIDGKHIEPYGLINKKSAKVECINYRRKPGALFWSVLFFPSVAMPVAILGFNFYEPVDKDRDCEKKE